MSLYEKIEENLKQSMVQKNAETTSVLRMLKSALKYVAIEKKLDKLADADAQQVIQKQIKQRKESIDQFQKAGRTDLAEKEAKEVAILETFLPKQMSDADLETAIKAEIASQGAASKKDFGRMMKHMNDKLSGQAEARRVSEMLGKFLQ